MVNQCTPAPFLEMASHRRKLNRRWSASRLLSLIFIFLCSSPVYCYAGDTLKHGQSIVFNETLVSAREKFELRFFTTTINATGPQSFVGIFYHQRDLDSAVWVANRDNPLPRNFTGDFRIAEDGNLKVLDTAGKAYFSTHHENSSSTNRTVKLMDSGNLVLSNDDNMETSLWESFKNPTDTFLPGMKMDDKLTLTSWKGKDDPRIGLYTFKLDQQREGQYVVIKKQFYWKSGMARGKFPSSDDIIPPAIADLLSNFSKSVIPDNKSEFLKNTTKQLPTSRSLDFTRLVMNSNGQLQYLTWNESKRIWSLIWSKPEDECGIYNYCGKFGSCNINNCPLFCKCLPGFKPINPVDYWESRDFSGGCTRNSASTNFDRFLSLKMMKVSDPDLDSKVANETECGTKCLENSQCVAYLYQEAENIKRRGDTPVSDNICWIWSDRIENLQEEYPNQDRNLFVCVAKADIESTARRTCKPCGTNTIPYPLSTGQDCGDPMYFFFDCNTSSGQVSFRAPGGAHRVVSIDPSARNFVIQVIQEYPYARNSTIIPWLNDSLPFISTSTLITEVGNSTDQFEGRVEASRSQRKNKVGVQISWKPPLKEPTCTSSEGCKDWPNSTCNATIDGKLRCLCHPNFRWDGSNLNCIKEGDFPKSSEEPSKEPSKERGPRLTLIVALPLACMTALAGIIIYMWKRKMAKRQEVIRSDKRDRALRSLDSERHVKYLIDSVEPIEEDGEGIEVPFFNMGSILAATNNFSDTNKLGQGGYGPVYMGTFPGGQEIAVKRLLSVSGQGLQEFKNEVVLISKLQHRNLVKLRGYCIKGDEKILLYEYMPNKSLDLFLFDQNLSMLLDWKIRFNIILGIARGLLYLHQDSRLRIIHRDLKTSNILLDKEMNPKISDFGLARIVAGKETGDNTTRVAGTYGYMSPEYALDGLFSVKSDVYSFGVVLLEVISGKKNTGFYRSEEAMTLLAYAWRLWVENKVLDLMDQNLRESCDVDQLVKCVTIAFLCVQEDPSDRPTISNIVTMLDSETATVPNPKQPAFILERGLFNTASSSSRPETHTELTANSSGEIQNE